MAGRFPLYTDADIYGPLVDGLIDRGWDVARAVKTRPEGEDDIVHFTLAAEQRAGSGRSPEGAERPQA